MADDSGGGGGTGTTSEWNHLVYTFGQDAFVGKTVLIATDDDDPFDVFGVLGDHLGRCGLGVERLAQSTNIREAKAAALVYVGIHADHAMERHAMEMSSSCSAARIPFVWAHLADGGRRGGTIAIFVQPDNVQGFNRSGLCRLDDTQLVTVGAVNAASGVVTCRIRHGLRNGDRVRLGCEGNLEFPVRIVSETEFCPAEVYGFQVVSAENVGDVVTLLSRKEEIGLQPYTDLQKTLFSDDRDNLNTAKTSPSAPKSLFSLLAGLVCGQTLNLIAKRFRPLQQWHRIYLQERIL